MECALRVQLSQKNAPEIYSRMISVKLEGKTPEETQQTLTLQQPAAKVKVAVDTLARRESGKQLELSPEHKQSRQERSTEKQQEIEQVMAEVIEPMVDERDERIRQLEDQMSLLLNDQKRQSTKGVRHSDLNVSPTKTAGYRKFRLNGPEE